MLWLILCGFDGINDEICQGCLKEEGRRKKTCQEIVKEVTNPARVYNHEQLSRSGQLWIDQLAFLENDMNHKPPAPPLSPDIPQLKAIIQD